MLTNLVKAPTHVLQIYTLLLTAPKVDPNLQRKQSTMLLLYFPIILLLFTILFFHPSFRCFFEFCCVFELHSKGSKLPPGSFGWCPFLGKTLSFIVPHQSSSRGQFLNENIKRFVLFGYIEHNITSISTVRCFVLLQVWKDLSVSCFRVPYDHFM